MSSLKRYSKPLPVFNLGVSSLQGEVERRERAKKISNLLAGAVIATAKNGEFFRRPGAGHSRSQSLRSVQSAVGS